VSSSLHWHNLVEVLNFLDATLPERLHHNEQVLEAHLTAALQSSVLTPHAPYSVSPATFQVLNHATAGKTISVHNQETPAEDELFYKGGGDFCQLYNLTGTPPPAPTHRSSLQTWLPFFTKEQTILLVHNTFTKKEDIVFAHEHAAKHGLKLVFCLCPNANKYIEETLPPLELFTQTGCTLTLGTDSYSSNWQLSIAAEIKLLADHFSQVPLETLLQAATLNGADAFGWSHLGRLEKGKRPGLALLHLNDVGELTGTSERVEMRNMPMS
jgi:cytosine/adenosine deaminase-related metal-dependent hydrolase